MLESVHIIYGSKSMSIKITLSYRPLDSFLSVKEPCSPPLFLKSTKVGREGVINSGIKAGPLSKF